MQPPLDDAAGREASEAKGMPEVQQPVLGQASSRRFDAPREPGTRLGAIYLIEHTAGGYIKIGFAKKPFRRAQRVQADRFQIWPTNERCNVILLGWIPNADFVIERWLHREFHHHRVAGEWHTPDSPAIRWVKEHPGFIPYRGRQPELDPAGTWYMANAPVRRSRKGVIF